MDKEIVNMANSKKMSENSYRMLIKKLENELTLALMDIDKENKKKLTFEQVGRLMTKFGIFRIIEYDEYNRRN